MCVPQILFPGGVYTFTRVLACVIAGEGRVCWRGAAYSIACIHLVCKRKLTLPFFLSYLVCVAFEQKTEWERNNID